MKPVNALQTKPFDAAAAIAYAQQWATARNPKYADFETMGGDCSNYISQCLLAGGAVMNETPDTGWYYRSLNSRAPAWSGVLFLWDFLLNNRGRGPFGHEIPLEQARPGDIIQLKFAGKPDFSHTVLVIFASDPAAPGNVLVNAHSYDCADRPLDSYSYVAARALRVDGVRA
jgi:hypothetical protein